MSRHPAPQDPCPLELSQPFASISQLGGEAALGSRSWPRFHLSLQGCIHPCPASCPAPSGLAWLASLSSLRRLPGLVITGSVSQYLGSKHMPLGLDCQEVP